VVPPEADDVVAPQFGFLPVTRGIISTSALLSARFFGSSSLVRNSVTDAVVDSMIPSSPDAMLSAIRTVAIDSAVGNTIGD
jgi:hypothetical protein